MRKTRLKDTDQILFNMATRQLQANVIPAAPSTPFGNIDREMIQKKKSKERLFIYRLISVQQIGLRTPLSLAIAFY